MNLIIRSAGLYFRYLITRLTHLKTVKFNGRTIVYAFPGSKILFKEGPRKTIINSHPLSNLVGLGQRTILVSRYGGEIIIGSGCGISGSTLYSMARIEIGEDVLIGGNCKIIDNDFHPLDPGERILNKTEAIKKAPIRIGDRCFIGADSIILKGTELGRECIVGAGSVVHGVFPDRVIIAGNPARIIKEII